jgi:PIN domain nuclease of toxin-antitoxin system
LSVAARNAIGAPGNVVHVSIASAWEIAIKVGQGKLSEASTLLAGFEEAMPDEGFSLVPITVPHVRAAGLMATPHRDPFDRLLASQASIEGLTIVTADAKVQALGAPWLW